MTDPQELVVVVSDLHVAETHPERGDDSMLYNRASQAPDGDFQGMVRYLLADAAHNGEKLHLVLAGDSLEFYTPSSREPLYSDRPLTESGSLIRLRRIVLDHPVFFDALAEVIAAGGRLSFLCGNHDPALGIPAVQAQLRHELVLRAREQEVAPQCTRHLGQAVGFGWGLMTMGDVWIEHGHLLDALNSIGDPASPLDPHSGKLELIFGSVSFMRGASRAVYLNPNRFREFVARGGSFMAGHIIKNYSPVEFVVFAVHVIVGMVRTLRDVASARRRPPPLGGPKRVELPSQWNLVRIFRLDRVLLGAFAFSGLIVIVWVVPTGTAQVGLLALLTAGSVMYLRLFPSPSLDNTEDALDLMLERARARGAKVVVFGHTHDPLWRREQDLWLGNCGSWTPSWVVAEEATTQPEERRPVIMLRQCPVGGLCGGLYRWSQTAGLEPECITCGQGVPDHGAPSRVPPRSEPTSFPK